MGDLADIPGYEEEWWLAWAKTRAMQARAFLPFCDRIAGVEIREMTLDDLLALDLAGNAYALKARPRKADANGLLWLLSRYYRPVPPGWLARAAWTVRRWWFNRRVNRRIDERAMADLAAYVERMFLDSPGRSRAADGEPPVGCFVASQVALLASEFHWGAAEIRRLPLPQLFQYADQIRARHNPKWHKMHRLTTGVDLKFMREYRKREAAK